MQNNWIDVLTQRLKDHWHLIEAAFDAHNPNKAKGKDSVTFSEQLFAALQTVFQVPQLELLPPEVMQAVLLEMERRLNLTLYYWLAPWDSSKRFSDIVEQAGCHGSQGLLSIASAQSQNPQHITIAKEGLYLATEYGNGLPQILPVSKILLFSKNIFLEPHTLSQDKLFDTIRLLQREIFLMVDEWEYQNALLAQYYMQSWGRVSGNTEKHFALLDEINQGRQRWADFCLESFVDFQTWVNAIPKTTEPIGQSVKADDIAAEIDALGALLLSASQKFLLPAAISKMAYNIETLHLFARFFKARIQFFPSDFSARLCLQAIQSALGEDIDASLFEILQGKPFSWRLCFDPAAALKSFCWRYSRAHHTILVSLLALAFFKKQGRRLLDDNEFEGILSTYVNQEHFLEFLQKKVCPHTPLTLAPENKTFLLQNLRSFLIEYAQANPHSQNGTQLIESFLQEFEGVPT